MLMSIWNRKKISHLTRSDLKTNYTKPIMSIHMNKNNII